jgi:hypothetical protein
MQIPYSSSGRERPLCVLGPSRACHCCDDRRGAAVESRGEGRAATADSGGRPDTGGQAGHGISASLLKTCGVKKLDSPVTVCRRSWPRERFRPRVLLTCLLYRLLCFFVRLLARRGGERELELVVLRHQVAILRRGGRRPRYTAAERALLAAVSRLLPTKRWSCFAVRPQTLRRWHRALLQGDRRRRGRPGRPPLAAETRSLILRLARENPRWGYMRIQGELLKLGINVSATTVATMLRVSGLGPAPRRIGPGWSELLRAQAQSVLGAGLPSERGGGLEGNVSARSAATPEGAPREAEADGSSATMPRCRGPPGRRCQVCRRCRQSPLCLLPATRRPRRGGHRSNGMRAMDQAHAGAPCMRERVDRAVKAGACARAALRAATTGRVPRGRCRTLHPRPAAHRADPPHRRQVNRVSLPHRVRT